MARTDFRLMPHAGVAFELLAQHTDNPADLDEVAASADFAHLTASDTTAYEHVLAAAITGDRRSFARMDVVEQCWRIVADILTPITAPSPYQPGTWGPTEADRLVDDALWFPLENV